jgi:hypothetical protein
MIKRLLFASLLYLPVAAWALYKPMRIITPEWVAGGGSA